MSARKVGYESFSLRDDDASLSVSGVARSVFSVFVSPSDDDEKDDDDKWKLETRIARAMMMLMMMMIGVTFCSSFNFCPS